MPSKISMLALALAVASPLACSLTFEEARLAGPAQRKDAMLATPGPSSATPRDDAYCRTTSAAQARWSAIAKTSGLGAGAGGVASWPVGEKARPAVAITAGILGLVAVFSSVLASSEAEAWARECATHPVTPIATASASAPVSSSSTAPKP